jgi:ATP-binding protein involved in chromosome partitioning
MLSRERIEQALDAVPVPGVGVGAVQLNLLRGIDIQSRSIQITLASTGLTEATQQWLQARLKEALAALPGAGSVEVTFKEVKLAEINQFGHILAVLSGKGGVGKSVVSSLLAISLSRLGYTVGLLDADLTGPSIPRMFGITARPDGTPQAILPVLSKTGIEVMSLNLILPAEDEAVIWRGPIITSVIRQFWEGVLWGKRDFLIVDLPPGTADAPLTVMQSIPITGVVMVFTPQALASMIVRKTIKMAQKMQKPILGVVENMSYLYIPELDKKYEIFGPSQAERMAQDAGAPLLAQLPIDPELTKLCDEGHIELYTAEVVGRLGKSLLKSLTSLESRDTP